MFSEVGVTGQALTQGRNQTAQKTIQNTMKLNGLRPSGRLLADSWISQKTTASISKWLDGIHPIRPENTSMVCW